MILLLASMAALGAYLAAHGFRDGRWGGYVVLYAAGVAGAATWGQWSGLTQSIRLELVFGFVLVGVALWGMALFDVVSRADASLGSRVGYIIFLLLIPPYGVIDWAIDRTDGRLRAEVISLTIATTATLLGSFAVNAWCSMHGLRALPPL
ncbi:MAG TPA: hypothetical protein VGL20_19225 [Candidatus Dormibacteraeota bacterium]